MLVLLTSLGFAAEDPPETHAVSHTLDNGLTVVVEQAGHGEAAVLLEVGVGSQDERPGEYGVAHLFEHMLINDAVGAEGGSVNASASGIRRNAWTWASRTTYAAWMPPEALDLALYQLAERLGGFGSSDVQALLDQERKVVLSERNERRHDPNSWDWDALAALQYPEGHPLHHPVLGTQTDLAAFTAQGARRFWWEHYSPDNATLYIVGDLDPDLALASARQWFGAVPAREIEEREVDSRAPTRGEDGYRVDEAGRNRALMSWAVTGAYADDRLRLFLLASILSHTWIEGEGGGQYVRILPVMSPEYQDLFDGLLEREVERIDTQDLDDAREDLRRAWLSSSESALGRAELLAECRRATGDVNCLEDRWQELAEVTPADLRSVAASFLSESRAVTFWAVTDHARVPSGARELGFPASLEGRPAAAVAAQALPVAEWPVRRAPLVPQLEAHRLPEPTTVELEPGLTLYHLRVAGGEHAQVVVRLGRGVMSVDERLRVEDAAVAGQFCRATVHGDAREIREEKQELGASVALALAPDTIEISLSADNEKLGDALRLLASCLDSPSYKDAEPSSHTGVQEGNLESVVLRVLPLAWYTDGPWVIRDTPADWDRIAASSLESRHDRLLAGAPLSVLVTADLDLDTVRDEVQATLGGRQRGGGSRAEVPTLERPRGVHVVAVDVPDATQARIALRTVAPAVSDPASITMQLVYDALAGGGATDRLDSELRRSLGLTYGVQGGWSELRYAPSWTVHTELGAPQVSAAIEGIERVLQRLVDEGLSGGELESARTDRLLAWNRAPLDTSLARWFYDYVLEGEDLALQKRRLNDAMLVTPASSRKVARAWLGPDSSRLWVIAGPREEIEPGLQELGWKVEWTTLKAAREGRYVDNRL